MPSYTDGMTIRDIQWIEARDTKSYFPNHTETLDYLAIAMAGEVGEVCNIIKKFDRGSINGELLREELSKELPDILIYLVMLAEKVGIDLQQAWINKKEYNDSRFLRERPFA